LGMLENDPTLARPVCNGSSLLRVQVAYGVLHEQVRCPADLLRRRTPLALAPGRGLDELDAVSEQMARMLAADGQVRLSWQDDYRRQTEINNDIENSNK
ncbi:MAG: hypothetical protein C0614_02260, partial [Desulfuromonas sp.]